MSDRMSVDEFSQRMVTAVEGAKTGTHKLVLLLALAGALRGQHHRTTVSLAELGHRTIEVMWRQVRNFVPAVETSPRRLSQLRPNGKADPQSGGALFDAVHDLRRAADENQIYRPEDARRQLPETYRVAHKRVVDALWKHPLKRLQGHGAASAPPYQFLYEWPVRGGKRRGEIDLLPGAADLFNRFLPLIQPIIQFEFLRVVAAVNTLPMTNVALENHLFGVERAKFPSRVRDGLHTLQNGHCFYDSTTVLARNWQVDHFIPWSVVPNDSVQNLVAATERRNNSKRRVLPSLEHLERWITTLQQRDTLGTRLLDDNVQVQSDLARTVGIARYAYSLLRPGMALWIDVAANGKPKTQAQTEDGYRMALGIIDAGARRLGLDVRPR